MTWDIQLCDTFIAELFYLDASVLGNLEGVLRALQAHGPRLSRPHADTLNGSKHPNMKELRFHAMDGVWRVAFAFDPSRTAILLAAGDKKSGTSEKRFYKHLIARADARFDEHLKVCCEPLLPERPVRCTMRRSTSTLDRG